MSGTNHRNGEDAEMSPLTPAEWEILPLLIAGEHEKEIALELSKGWRTVNKQIGSIYRKLEVNCRGAAINRWHEIQARMVAAQYVPHGVNTPLQPPNPPANNRPVARKTARRKKRP